MKINQFFLLIILLSSSSAFAEEIKFAVSNESKVHNPAAIEVTLDDRKIVSGSFEYHLNEITDSPEKYFSSTAPKGRHLITVEAAGKNYSFEIEIPKEGYYVDLRFTDEKAQNFRKDYADGRILLKSGPFEIVMAKPGVIGYD